jgi:hypothetical protein
MSAGNGGTPEVCPYLFIIHAEGARLAEVAFGPLVANAVEKCDDFTGKNALPVPELEWTSEHPSRVFFPLATEALVDSSGKLEVVGDESRGQVKDIDADQAEQCYGYFESAGRETPFSFSLLLFLSQIP